MKKEINRKNKYEQQVCFLYDLINEFTIKSKVNSKIYYFSITREIAGKKVLQGFIYNQNGLSKNKNFFKKFNSEKDISEKAKYLATLARLLSFIYEKNSKKLGKDKASLILNKAYKKVSQRYSMKPDIEGYVPLEVTGKAAAAAAAAAAALDVSLTEQMLNFMISEIIENENIQKSDKSEIIQLDIVQEIESIYRNKLGQLGVKQYEKIGKSNNVKVIEKQIQQMAIEKIISEKQKDEILVEVREAINKEENYNNLELSELDFFGVDRYLIKGKKGEDIFGIEKKKQNKGKIYNFLGLEENK